MLKHRFLLVLVGMAWLVVVAACAVPPAAPVPVPTAAPVLTQEVAQPVPEMPAAPAMAQGIAFSDPTNITNPFCPKSTIAHLLMLGEELDLGVSLRTEETLLPMTRKIEWAGGEIDAVVNYYVAYVDGHLAETAFDFYAQDDAGNLYYLGEDVTNYEDGQVLNHEGTWLAGREGAPAAMFMPAQPEIGMTWNPENRPGLVLEEDEVMSLSETVMTPAGEITDGMLIQETLMDGAVEFKTWARGYCDVLIDAPDEQAQLVLVNYTTDAVRAIPASLSTIHTTATTIFDASANGGDVSQAVEALATAWATYREKEGEPLVPAAFQNAMDTAVSELQAAVGADDAPTTRRAALAVLVAGVDLSAYYNPAVPVDITRMANLKRELLMALASDDLAAAPDIMARASALWVRLRPFVVLQNGAPLAADFEQRLTAQIAAVANNTTDGLEGEIRTSLELLQAMEGLFEAGQ